METTERNTERAKLLFEELGGTVNDGFPAIHSQVHHTKVGTPYLKSPGVVVLARPQTNVADSPGFWKASIPTSASPSISMILSSYRISPNSARRLANVLRLIRPETKQERCRRRVFRAAHVGRTWQCTRTFQL